MENEHPSIDREKLMLELITAAGHLAAGVLSCLKPERAAEVHRQLEDGSRYIQVGIAMPTPFEGAAVTVALAGESVPLIPLGAVKSPVVALCGPGTVQ